LAVRNWLAEYESEGLFLSVITVGEIQQGIHRLPDSEKQRQLRRWLGDSILGEYGAYILPVDTETMLIWGRLTAELISKGRKVAVMDSLIAATAVQHGLSLVTRNDSDFLDTGLVVVNPWVENG
jgi:predicted nucleic acid-binding protein